MRICFFVQQPKTTTTLERMNESVRERESLACILNHLLFIPWIWRSSQFIFFPLEIFILYSYNNTYILFIQVDIIRIIKFSMQQEISHFVGCVVQRRWHLTHLNCFVQRKKKKERKKTHTEKRKYSVGNLA